MEASALPEFSGVSLATLPWNQSRRTPTVVFIQSVQWVVFWP